MRNKTKTITMPDNRIITLRASYNGNMEWAKPSTEGPVEALLSLIGLDDIGTIPGTQFEGWFAARLATHGCTWTNTSDNGDWIEWTE